METEIIIRNDVDNTERIIKTNSEGEQLELEIQAITLDLNENEYIDEVFENGSKR